MMDISKGFYPDTWTGGAAWSTDDFHTVLRCILDSPHAAAPVAALATALGEGGAAKLQSMNANNLLLRRAYDDLARDIDTAAFGRTLEDVYTLPTAAHTLAARSRLGV